MAEDGPLIPHRETARPEWTDYNGHMNLAYYLLAFDHATDTLQEQVGLGTEYRERTGGSIFVVEAHLTYDDEVKAGEELTVTTRVLGVDDKRLHLFHEMSAGPENSGQPGRPVATNELMILHVDLGTRRAAPFPEAPRARLEGLQADQARQPPPAQAGRRIAMAKKR